MVVISILAAFCLASAVITYGLGIYVFSKNPSSLPHRLFLISMLVGTYWALGEFMLWQATGAEAVQFWLKVSAFWPLSMAFTLHFVLAFTGHPFAKREKLPWLLLLVYLPSLAIAFIGTWTDALFVVQYIPGTGFTYVPAEQSSVRLVASLYNIALMIASAGAGILSFARAKQEKIRRQSGIITAGIFILIISGTLSDLILPANGIYLPNIVFFGIIIFSFLISYAIVRHDLFVLSPERALPDIFRTMPDGLILADMDDRIVIANAAATAIMNGGTEAPDGKSAGSILPPDIYRAIRSAVIASGTVTDFEAVLPTGNNNVVSISASLVRDPDHEPAGIILIIHDITRRKEQERALRVANDKISLLDQLTRHDISNLVTALASYLTLLRHKNCDGKTSEQYLDSCLDLVEKITQHLRFSREYREIGLQNPAWQPLDGVVNRAISGLAHQGVMISSRFDDMEIYADPLVSKVIYNICENSLRHGGHVTRICLSSGREDNGALLLIIEDDGTGIPTGEKEAIFRRGFGKNTGLGLALSREILSVTGITIAENGIYGKCARFVIRIPPSAWRFPVQKDPQHQN